MKPAPPVISTCRLLMNLLRCFGCLLSAAACVEVPVLFGGQKVSIVPVFLRMRSCWR